MQLLLVDPTVYNDHCRPPPLLRPRETDPSDWTAVWRAAQVDGVRVLTSQSQRYGFSPCGSSYPAGVGAPKVLPLRLSRATTSGSASSRKGTTEASHSRASSIRAGMSAPQ